MAHLESLGGDHAPIKDAARRSLVLSLTLTGGYHRAVELSEQAMRHQTRGRPGGNPADWEALTRSLRLRGDLSATLDVAEDAYAYSTQQLGPGHPTTLRIARELAIARRQAGAYQRSYELAVQAYDDHLRYGGQLHPDTLAAAVCLANTLRARALLASAQALTLTGDAALGYARVLTQEHPFPNGVLGNLAVLFRLDGDPAAARKLNEEALGRLDARLGRDHHYSLTVAANLASDLAELGEAEAAVTLGRDTWHRLRSLLGPAHPATLGCAVNLAIDLMNEGAAEGEALMEETLREYARTPDTQSADSLTALERRRITFDFDPPPL